MYYLVYQITNLKNGRIYIGVHKTEKVDDGYMGSGKLIKRAIAQAVDGKFQKDILFYCNSEEEMYNKEAELVTTDFVKRADTYNIAPGGRDGLKKLRKLKRDERRRKRFSRSRMKTF